MPGQHRVLLIDDSPLVLEVTRYALEAAGYDVDVAANLETFEAHRAARSPDLIVVDVQMPEAFGDDLATTLRGAYGVEVPILLLSTLPEDELARRAAQAEVWGYVSKQDGLGSLVTTVREALAHPNRPGDSTWTK
jgi:DNA-binding response OmpR family regulator